MNGQTVPEAHSRPLHYVADAKALADLVARLRAVERFGIDSESNSMHAYFERVCLVQISTDGFDALLDPLRVELAPIADVLADERMQKVFHAAEQDIIGFKRDFGFEVRNVFDTSIAARMLQWPEHGLGSILERHFDHRSDKRFQKYDWGRRPLDDDAVAYASADARYLPALADLQRGELQAGPHWEVFVHACERVTRAEVKPRVFDPDGFWKLRGARELEPQARAVLARLWRWRDKVARELDRPPFKVFGDAVLLELARVQPRDVAGLAEFKGIHARLRTRRGWQIVQLIAQTQSGDIPELTRRQRRPWDAATRNRYEALRRWRRDYGSERGLDPDLVLAKTTLQELATEAPGTEHDLEHIASLDAWERARYGSELLRVLASEQPQGPTR